MDTKPMRLCAQRLLDRAEGFACVVWLTFKIMGLKRALGLRCES